jgi:YegS/Rv2252/BmrU family lipid kinase
MILKVCCLLNENSGTAARTPPEQLVQLFSERGFSLKIINIKHGDSITALTNQVVKDGFDVVVAGGGDGTVNAVASVLVCHRTIRLGILPLGTLNHLVRDLGIPTDLAQAVRVICAGHSRAIDVGQVNDSYFLNNSSVGLYPTLVKLREKLQAGGRGKWWAATLSSVRIFARFRRLYLVLKLGDGPTITRKTALLFVGNNRYETTAGKIGARLSLNSGFLWVSISTSSSRMGMIKSLIAMLCGSEILADTMTFDAKSIQVTSKKKVLAVATDGEVLKLKTPLKYTIISDGLHVLVPFKDNE